MTSGLSVSAAATKRAAVGHLPDDVAFVRQQLLERAEQERVIVGEQHAGARHVQCWPSKARQAAHPCDSTPALTNSQSSSLCRFGTSRRGSSSCARFPLSLPDDVTGRGTVTTSRVLRPGVEWISNVPPIASTRSPMLIRPSPSPMPHRRRTPRHRRRWSARGTRRGAQLHQIAVALCCIFGRSASLPGRCETGTPSRPMEASEGTFSCMKVMTSGDCDSSR